MTLGRSTSSDLAPAGPAPGETGALTPAGLQPRRRLARRRLTMLAVNLATLGVLAAALANVLGAGGWDAVDVGLFACFLISAPWMILGFWNATVGLWLLRVRRDGLAQVSPFADELTAPLDAPPLDGGRIAVLMTLRNEDPERAFARLLAMRAELDRSGAGARFDMFVLSDTDAPAIAAREAELFAQNRARLDGAGAATYRRRADNAGFKAGNVRDFIARWGADYEMMLPLDADSVMSADAILRLTRVMDRHPKLGILQSLCVGAPSSSGFAKLFQFGMRHGMRSFTMGSAWWQGDCGPFWGHNALVRMRPFDEACRLPVLPGAPPLGGHILSHDQVEAVLMRRAGYEVRVAPIEGESWEDNPVTVLDFMKREQRWCNGNMQYFALLGMRGIQPASRFQLFQAIMMYLGAPAWMLMTVLAAAKAVSDDLALYDGALAVSLFAIMVGMSLAPKAAGLLDSALEPGGVRRYGGPARFAGGAAAELLFSMLMAPAVALRLSIFLAGLPFGRKIGWNGQIRDAYGVDWSDAARGLWPQTVLGAAVIATLAVGAPTVLYWAAPVLLGLTLAIPFAVATASPRFGRALSALGLGAIPEEVRPAPILQAVAREAAALSAAAPDPAAPAPAESVATPAPLAGPAVLTPGE